MGRGLFDATVDPGTRLPRRLRSVQPTESLLLDSVSMIVADKSRVLSIVLSHFVATDPSVPGMWLRRLSAPAFNMGSVTVAELDTMA